MRQRGGPRRTAVSITFSGSGATDMANRSKNRGTAFESLVVTALQDHLGPETCRRTTSGAKDRGDIHGLYIRGLRTVAECKNTKAAQLGTHWAEVEVERGNDDADVGLLILKRHGKGQALDQWVTLTLRELLTIVMGVRPDG